MDYHASGGGARAGQQTEAQTRAMECVEHAKVRQLLPRLGGGNGAPASSAAHTQTVLFVVSCLVGEIRCVSTPSAMRAHKIRICR